MGPKGCLISKFLQTHLILFNDATRKISFTFQSKEQHEGEQAINLDCTLVILLKKTHKSDMKADCQQPFSELLTTVFV